MGWQVWNGKRTIDPTIAFGIPGAKKRVTATSQKGEWESIKSFGNLEPRASFMYQVSSTASIKGSYNRMNQYIHLISNTTAATPIDIWQASTNNVKPQQGDQVALRFFKNLNENKYETSAEVYCKWTKNQVDYIDGADLFINIIRYFGGSKRNNVRIPDYHRLDVSVTISNIWRGKKERSGEDHLIVSICNVYARKNPFSVSFSQGKDRQPGDKPLTTSYNQTSIIGTLIPSVSYNFKF
jgi:hypothetical protein